MIWLVILLLLLISFFWLFEPIFSGRLIWAAEEEPEIDQSLIDRIESIKTSLKDLDHEHQIGRLDTNDFETLKSELISEWQELEKKLTVNYK